MSQISNLEDQIDIKESDEELEQEEEEEENDEFELLCNQAQAEERKEQRKKEIRQMNKQMDQKLDKLLGEKKQDREFQIINETQDMKEENSGLLIMKGTRKMNSDEVEAYVNGRKFIPLEEIDSKLQDCEGPAPKAYFTVGVAVDIGRVQTSSKSNKRFCTLKLTDLNKYDLFKAKQQMAQKFKGDKDGLKMAEKSLNNNGYKVMKVMLFNEIASKIQDYTHGAILGVIQPKPLKPTMEYGYTYCVDLEAQIFQVGISEEYSTCKYIGKDMRQCYTFMNKSVEKICDPHRFLQQQEQMMRFKANRQVMNSEYIDINSVRKQHSLMMAQEKIGAFESSFGRKKSKKAPVSPKTHARLIEAKKKEQAQFNDYLKQREDRNNKNTNTQARFKNLVCFEKSHLNRSAYDNPASIVENQKSQKNKNQTQESEEDEGLEFIQSDKNQSNPSLKNMLNMNRKMLHAQRFGSEDEDKDDENLKRKKLD